MNYNIHSSIHHELLKIALVENIYLNCQKNKKNTNCKICAEIIHSEIPFSFLMMNDTEYYRTKSFETIKI